jgi:hypothetical protein
LEISNQLRPESNDQLFAEFNGQFIRNFQLTHPVLDKQDKKRSKVVGQDLETIDRIYVF